jgi:CheY-like chemotaxis protein
VGARVLVVDDDPWILRMVSATLEKKAYVVDTAREGRAALERARAVRPDVIISDVMMPVMDGWTFVQQLRGIPQLATIPVIFLTALGKDEARLRELGLSPDDYLAKPFRFSDLEKRVAAALANQQPGSYRTAPGRELTPIPGEPLPYPYPPGYPPPPYPPAAGYPASAPYPYPPGYPPAAPPYPPGPGWAPGYPPPAYPPYPPAGPPPTADAPGSNVAPLPQPPGPPPVSIPTGGPPPLSELDSTAPLGPPREGAPAHVTQSGSFPAQRRNTAMSGRLEQLGLSSLLVMMEMERKDGLITLKELESGDVGRIFLRGGQVVSARVDNRVELDGRQSVYTMLTWRAGAFSFNAMEVEMVDTVNTTTTHLLMEGARLMDESNREGDL